MALERVMVNVIAPNRYPKDFRCEKCGKKYQGETSLNILSLFDGNEVKTKGKCPKCKGLLERLFDQDYVIR